ncbi:MAG: 3-isopropylmalate dehydratase large subunit [Pseudomonadota bacterium]
MAGQTLYDKVWDAHVVRTYATGEALLYIDRHLVQEVSSPQAFTGLATRGLSLHRPEAHIAVADHAVPTDRDPLSLREGLAAKQIARLEDNARRHGLPYIPTNDDRHGIVHIIGPELGFTLPGATLVCGDSHTSTHGAFGALSFGIGTSECEMVFATQTLLQRKQKRLRVLINGELCEGVSTKDVILAVIRKIGVAGGQNHAIEFAGPGVRALSMEARMTLCNMAIEAGSRIGMIAPDETTFEYLQNRPLAPKGALWSQAVTAWRELQSDPDAEFDDEVTLSAGEITPHVSWGTTPAQCAPISETIPDPSAEQELDRRAQMVKSLKYMDLKPGTPLSEIEIDTVFVGSCTNGRIEDLRRTARVLKGKRVAPGVRALVVPGSAKVRADAENEGLDRIFKDAGFEWRRAGCSMCVAMNNDRLNPGERCASTSNRNFEGRQGPEGRTHLMSPEMAAAAAITGRLSDVRILMNGR